MKPPSWVIFESLVHAHNRRLVVVCSREEWNALPPDLQTEYTLLHENLTTEGAAERLARSLAGLPTGKRVA